MSSFCVNSVWFTVRPHKELCWHSFKVTCHAVGTEQGRSRSIWSRCQPPRTPHIQRAMQALPIPLFSSSSLAVCCPSSDPSAPYIVYFPDVYISLLSPLHPLRFSPQNKSTCMKFAGWHPNANFCRFTKSTLFKQPLVLFTLLSKWRQKQKDRVPIFALAFCTFIC